MTQIYIETDGDALKVTMGSGYTEANLFVALDAKAGETDAIGQWIAAPENDDFGYGIEF